MSKWGEVTPSIGAKFLTEPSKYTFRIVEAWDSLLAPKGTYDHKKKKEDPAMHYFGFLLEVILPEDSPQVGRMQTLRLYAHTDKTQAQTKAIFGGPLNSTIHPDAEADDPLSVGELIGQCLTAIVDNTGVPNKPRLDIAPWNIFSPPESLANKERELYVDNENEASVKHYEGELARAKRRQESEKENSMEVPPEDEEELPF